MNRKEKLRFKIIEFLYEHKLFGIHKKCWADLVVYAQITGDWESVSEYSKCGYCGACMSVDEIEEFINNKNKERGKNEKN